MNIDNRINILKKKYNLKPHIEGGWFYEDNTILKDSKDKRPSFGVFGFLIIKNEINHFHILDCDEIWCFHEGCGLTIHIIDIEGNHKTLLFGNDIEHGQVPYVIFKKGTTFGAENLDNNSYTFFIGFTIPKFKYEGLTLLIQDEKTIKSPLAKMYTIPSKNKNPQ